PVLTSLVRTRLARAILVPYTKLLRSDPRAPVGPRGLSGRIVDGPRRAARADPGLPRSRDRPEVRRAGSPFRRPRTARPARPRVRDRKSTRLNSCHFAYSSAVFFLDIN